MKKKYGFMLSAVLAAGTLLSACGTNDANNESSGGGSSEGGSTDFKVAMVTDTGGVDDKSFNQSAWEGLQQFGKDNDLEKDKDFKYVQSTAASDYQPNLSGLIREDYNLVFGIGFLMQQDIQTIAAQKPDAQLALVDSVAVNEDGDPMENVASITFKEHQGSFLVGVIAGMQSESNKVGFIGGVDSELIKKFESGFKAGVKSVNPDAEIFTQYADDFNAAEKGQQIAATLYDKGADIIYHAAGGTGNGVFTEAKNRAKNGEKVWVIGVDRDQHEEGMPENVTLTSMIKRVDTAVIEVSKQTMDGNFPGGKVTEFGLEEDGVGIAESQENVSEEALQKVEEYKEKIQSGDLEVPSTDEEYEKFESSL